MNEEVDKCESEFKRLGMQSFGDYVKYYNDLDVSGMVEGIEGMMNIYISRGILRQLRRNTGTSTDKCEKVWSGDRA